MTDNILKILSEKDSGKHEIAERLGKKGRTRYLNELIAKLVKDGLIEMTIPEKPNSRMQKYRLTANGKNIRLIAGEE